MIGCSSAFSSTRLTGRTGRIGGAAAAIAAAVVMIGGCGAAPHAAPSHGTRPQGKADLGIGGTISQHASGNLAATRALALASSSARRVTSLTMTETMIMRGLPLSAGGGLMPGASPSGAAAPLGGGRIRMTLVAKMRLKPSLLAAMSISMSGLNMRALGDRSLRIDEVLTARAIYLKMPGLLPTPAGRPWAKISLASLPDGMDLRKLFSQMQSGNPVTAMDSPALLAKFLATAKHLRVIGDQSLDGVPVTEYSGTVSLHSLMTAMPAAERRLLGSAPASLHLSGLPFKVWIDRQHHTRKMVMRFAFGKVSMAVTVHVTSINKAVRISAPPASQVSALSSP
jgi:hypothetical protein